MGVERGETRGSTGRWTTTIDRAVTPDDDCTEIAGLLQERRDHDRETRSVRRAIPWAALALVVAVPLLLYSELLTPTGSRNFFGMAIGAALMAVGWWSYAR
ncbi:hypothetical protein [Natronorarus salvus]|uniref:hypothetical protein n=1 Tax=Natronorarus salvus TaxID=3117733 RepID=UPI002F265E4C